MGLMVRNNSCSQQQPSSQRLSRTS